MPRRPSIEQMRHQVEGTDFLRRNERAALFDEQGLGKSKQLIDAIAAQVAAGELEGAVIICPNGLKTNWAEEIRKFSDLPLAVFGAGRKARRSSFARLKAAFYVINYEAVGAELASLKALLRFKPMALVLDESHRIKTPEARVTAAAHQLRASAKRRYILSGTPVANKPEDLWSQFYFLDDGASLGATLAEFRSRYKSEAGGYTGLDDLRDRVGGLSKRRLKDHAVALPTKRIRRLRLEMAGRQLELYDQMRNELAIWVQSLDGSQVLREAEAILARLIRLAQLASNPAMLDAAYGDEPCKFLALDALLLEKFGGVANAMHERFSEDVRPEFIDIIRELQPIDESVARRQPKLLNTTTLFDWRRITQVAQIGSFVAQKEVAQNDPSGGVAGGNKRKRRYLIGRFAWLM